MRTRHNRGAVLVLAMWLLVILGVMLLALNRVTVVNAARGRGVLERVQVRWLARAGIEQALDLLALDASGDDGPFDQWYDDPDSFQNIELGPGHAFTVSAYDEAFSDNTRFGLDDPTGKINVNFAAAAQLNELPDTTEQMVDAILDWRDGNEESRPGGAERAYYDGLAFPYDIRNGLFRTHREMLLVRDVTSQVFNGTDSTVSLARLTTVWGYDSNFSPTGQQKIDLSNLNASDLATRFNLTQSLADEIEEEEPDDPFDLAGLRGDEPEEGKLNELDFQWVADHFEEFAAGGGRGGGQGAGGRRGSAAPTGGNQQRASKVNINTAPRDVLLTLPGLDDAAAESILSTRGQSGGFVTIGDLYAAKLVEDEQFRELAPAITVRTNVLRVVSTGTAPGGVTQSIEAVIDRGSDTPTILYWRQSE